MQDKVLQLLEFHKVKEQLCEHVSSSLGRQKVDELKPFTTVETVRHEQNATDEGVAVLRLQGRVPLGGIHDIRPAVKRAEIGGTLNREELLAIASTISAGRQLKKFIETLCNEDEAAIPILAELCEGITPATQLEKEIKRCIADDGHVFDSASPELSSVRQQLRSYEARIREKLEAIIRSSTYQKMLSDAIVTIRNERYVLPVKQEYRSSFAGMVHDQSASGATLFMEPQSVVTINNQLREAKVKERQAIEKILAKLSAAVLQSASSLQTNMTLLAELDFIFAKAYYAQELKATKPSLNTDGFLRFKQARHPLLAKDEVVPITVELGEEYTSLVITGPNTGGKTVALKTIGLITLMAQSGLHIPVSDGSEVAVFKAVYADIGDEQSLEQSLSTFSSHMTNIVDILQHVDGESLVLFDELGAGTDPQEGAALAIAILDNVYKQGTRVVATTHYSELKAYAYNRPGVMNASVEFDVETLQPTYRLLIGVPGRSNAFDIARRLGLDRNIIELAQSQISGEANKVENMISSLERTKKHAEEERTETQNILAEAERLRSDLEKQLSTFKKKRERMLKEAEEEAKRAVETAETEAREILKELRSYRDSGVKEHQLIAAKKRLEKAVPNLTAARNTTQKQADVQQDFRPGDEVKVLSLDQKGHITRKINKTEYLVQVGIMKVNIQANDLKKVEKQQATDPSFVSIKGTNDHVKTELDLRGKRYEDAQLEVGRYLDDAILAGYRQVAIIHGKGTGALRKGVKEWLQDHPNVKGMRAGRAGEGGSGVTVVELQ